MNFTTYFIRVVCLAFILFVFSIPLKSQCGQPDGTIIVNSAADEGTGTLRDAINCANILEGPNRIVFAIPTTERVIIQVGSTSGTPLPSLVNPGTIIDGTTQNGFGENGNFLPQIILDGSVPVWNAPIDALKIFGSESEIYALEIRNFPDDGIDVDGADNVIIGDEERGNVIYNCGIDQDFFPATGNVGPYNGVGIIVDEDADNIEILSNYLGTDFDRNPNLGNEWAGIFFRRGSDFGLVEGNIIADNSVAIRLDNSFAVTISENELFCNDTVAIELISGANDDKIPPVINTATNSRITGTGTASDEIQLFIADPCGDAVCQGSRFLGRTTVLNNGTWILDAAFDVDLMGGEAITATATDNTGRTSNFSDCMVATVTANCADANGIIIVTNSNDAGSGSLREAIICANDTPGPNTIQFNIPGNTRHQIDVGGTTGDPLPFLRDAGTIIDATTQAGFGLNGDYQPQIIIDGGSIEWRFPHNAIWVRADNCEIYGLEVRNFPDDGIDITAGDNIIIGAPNKGNVVFNCGSEKDIFEDDPNQREWNGCGIVLKSGVQNSIIQGNIVGTNYQQNLPIGNEFCGIIVQSNGSSDNLIGGANPGEGNIIAHNPTGIALLANTVNIQISGNSFYCNANGAIALSSNANNAQSAPSINVASAAVINGTGTDGDVIEVYLAATECATAPCQGNILFGRTTVSNNTWRLDAPFQNGISLEANDRITATATSTTGNTSPFSDCQTIDGVNPPPNCNLGLSISNFSNETCAGNDGTFTLNVNNATQPVSYDYGNGLSQSPVFSDLSAGAYDVTATDSDGCSTTLNVIITQEDSPSLSVVNTTNENCGAGDGSFSVEATGGQSPYIYELDNGFISRNPDFSDLSAGTYSVSVIDANNCVATQSVAIQRTGGLTIGIADMRSDNCNNASGSFRIAVSGGIAPYSYDLGNGAVSTNEFTGLSAGNYAVTVSDATNCSSIANVSISGGSAPVASIDNVQQTDCSNATGSVTIGVSGGQAPFQYAIGANFVNNPTFTNLAAGDYTVTVRDANNCITTQPITINEPAKPNLSIVSSVDATCGNANGTVSVLGSGGQAPYTYDIGRGITTETSFSSLAAGNYVVTIYDANNCADEIAVAIANSPTPTIGVANLQEASCDLDNAILTVEGTGVAPLTYDIGNGPSSSSTFSNLLPGDYSVTLTDGNNCSAVTAVGITSTGGPEVNIQNTAEARCDKSNGSFTVNAFGGFPPYTYDIGEGPTENPVFTSLSGGNYVVTLTDGNGCTATQSVTLGNLPAPTFGIGNIVDATCGASNGSFNVSAFGGLAPYRFSIGNGNSENPNFSDLAAGNYTVVVTDANNCTTALGVTLEGTEMPEVVVIGETAASCGTADGSFQLSVTGGNSPYFYDIGDGESTNPILRNLAVGNYDVTITDASGCSQIKRIDVPGSGEITVNLMEQLPATCNTANGTFTISPSGGQGPYSFTLNGQTTTDTVFTNLDTGTYELMTTDANGCSSIQNIEITASDGPEVDVEVVSNCGDHSAILNIAASQGISPFIYDIGDGPTTASTFRDVANGVYQVRVLDATGCETTKNIVVNVSNDEPQATISVRQEPDCNTDNGSIQINVSKGRPPFLYAMSQSEISPFPTFSNLSSGQYDITVTDAGGCSTVVPVTLGSEGSGPIAGFDFSFDNFEGSFSNTSKSDETYTWDFGDGNTASTENPTHTFSEEGTYSICLTVTNDCGTDTQCRNYTIEAVNINQAFEFDFGEVDGNVGDIVKVPVYVKNVRSAVGFQKSVILEDPSVAKFVSITDVTLKDLSPGLFNLQESQFTVSWFEGSIEGIDLPDSTIIYQIEVEILTDNACSNILIGNAPLETQVYAKDGNSEVEIEYFKRLGNVCSGDGRTEGQTAAITGTIYTEEGEVVNGVNINCTSTAPILNETDGTFSFEPLFTNRSYTVTPSKNVHPINGITTFDLVIIQNHILGNQFLDSPYKIIAADVNQSGQITVSDILELRALLLLERTEFSNNESWQFVPMDYEFSNPNMPLAEDYPSSASVNLNSQGSEVAFIGIKTGDVNNTAIPNNFTSSTDRSKTGIFEIFVDNKYLKAGETTTIHFAAKNLNALEGLQTTLKFDPSKLVVEKVETTSTFQIGNFGQSLLEKGYLLTSWLRTANSSDKVESNLFSLKITVKEDGFIRDFIAFSNEVLNSEAYSEDNQIWDIALSYTNKKIDLHLAQNQPNPFRENTVINYQLPVNAQVTMQIFDINGSLKKSIQQAGIRGKNEITLDRQSLGSGGVYFYQLDTPFGQIRKKMILIQR